MNFPTGILSQPPPHLVKATACRLGLLLLPNTLGPPCGSKGFITNFRDSGHKLYWPLKPHEKAVETWDSLFQWPAGGRVFGGWDGNFICGDFVPCRNLSFILGLRPLPREVIFSGFGQLPIRRSILGLETSFWRFPPWLGSDKRPDRRLHNNPASSKGKLPDWTA